MRIPNIKTSLPGPKAKAIIERDEKCTAPAYGRVYPLVVNEGRGCVIEDVDGNRYIDFCAGIAVVNTGHCHPRVMAAAHAQIDRFTHTCFQVTPYEPYVALCEKLNALAPGKRPRARDLGLAPGIYPPGPLNAIAEPQARFEVIDSFLSEFGVMGFEFGYAVADPSTLVLWEAQFGDFANGAQVIVDQFLAPVRGMFAPGDPKTTVHTIASSGDFVMCESRGQGKLQDGRTYDNRYAWAIELKDGLVYRIREYMDSHHVSTLVA